MAKKSKKAIVKPLHVQIYESMKPEDRALMRNYLSLMNVATDIHFRMSEEGQAKLRDYLQVIYRSQNEQVKQETKLSIEEVDNLPDQESEK